MSPPHRGRPAASSVSPERGAARSLGDHGFERPTGEDRWGRSEKGLRRHNPMGAGSARCFRNGRAEPKRVQSRPDAQTRLPASASSARRSGRQAVRAAELISFFKAVAPLHGPVMPKTRATGAERGASTGRGRRLGAKTRPLQEQAPGARRPPLRSVETPKEPARRRFLLGMAKRHENTVFKARKGFATPGAKVREDGHKDATHGASFLSDKNRREIDPLSLLLFLIAKWLKERDYLQGGN